LERERAFYRDQWGLEEVSATGGLVHFAATGQDEAYVVRLRKSDTKRLDVIGLATASRADVDSLHEKVLAAGCRIEFAPTALERFGGGYGFRFFSPDGLSFEVSAEVERRVTRPLPRGAAAPERISHIVLHSPRHPEATAFFTEVLGFRVSDWLGDFMVFLRCNEWHHRVALLPGPPCLNHVAYDMANLDEMMRGIAKLRRLKIDCLWGPGRHTAGNNTFSYFVTPAGFGVEYTAELERIDEATWQPTVHKPAPEVMDQWGIGSGGPHSMPKPEADQGLFQASPV
jgi:catechol 2,3-dioxygenase-like lactoylglutathione lyase family enzyme